MSKEKISSITVEELIAALQQCDPNAKVVFAYDYGDHWHTNVAGTISSASTRRVVYSSYHSMHKIADDEEECDEDKETESVVVLE